MKRILITMMMFVVSALSFASYTSDLTSRMDKLSKSLEKYYSGTTAEMSYATNKEYEAWDKELNKVYKLVLSKLSKKQQEVLRKEQREWIKKRDREAEKGAESFKGGNFWSTIYTSGQLEATKEKTIELAKRYDRLK